MPIYEYRRPDGSTFEVMQAFSDEPLTHDPETGASVQRVLHAPAVHFKGKGFYNTDYGTRKRQRENGASAEGAAKSDGASADGAKGEGAKSEGSSSSKSDGGSSQGETSKSPGAEAKKPAAAAA